MTPVRRGLGQNGLSKPTHNLLVIADEGLAIWGEVLGTGRAVETNRARLGTRKCRPRPERVDQLEHEVGQIAGTVSARQRFGVRTRAKRPILARLL
jgi:hypothetical protein